MKSKHQDSRKIQRASKSDSNTILKDLGKLYNESCIFVLLNLFLIFKAIFFALSIVLGSFTSELRHNFP